ncbi:hypothetical protein ABBQ32_000902 [Trebouxia sp. C0010 RCD-2024]
MPIFLFNYTDKMMHGIFRAITPGTLNINPQGWTSISHTPHTRYPAQVRVEWFEKCHPIVDRDFKEAIHEAFFTDRQFNYQLTASEARKLCNMFSRSAAKRLFEAQPAAAAAELRTSGRESPAPSGPASPTLGAWGVHTSRRPTPSSSTGSSDLRQAKSWKNTATAATTSPHSPNPLPDHNPRFEDTSTSREELAQPDGQMSHPAEARAASGGGEMALRGAPPGFDAQLESDSPQPAAVQTTENAWGALKVSPETVPPAAAAHPGAADPTAAASSPPLQPQRLPAKPMPASRAQRYRPDEAERLHAEQSDGDQEAKRSRTGQSPHHPDALTPSPPNSAAEGKALQAQDKHVAHVVTGSRQSPDPLAALTKQQQQQQQQQEQQQEQQQQQQQEEAGLEEEDVHMQGTTPKQSSGMALLATLTAKHAFPQQEQSIYLLGGGALDQSSMWLNTVDIYSPPTHSCTPGPPLPKQCAYGSALAVGNHLFYVGGGNGIDWFSSMLRLQLHDTEAEWEQMANMHMGRGSLCSAHLKSTLWAVGGRDSHTFHSSTECFHPALNTWTMGPSTNTKRFAAAGGALGGAIYITGGFDGATYTSTAERLDPRQKRWSSIPDMLNSRGSHACVVFDDKLYAIGGYAALKPLRDVEVYDPRANKWQDVASMNDTRAYFAGVACQGALYAIGGLSPEMGNPNYKQTFEKYDPVRDSWEVLQPAANTCLIEPS